MSHPAPRPRKQPGAIRQVILVGLPGVGKTTVGHLLARRHGLDFVDVDDFLERQQGMTVAEIFAQQGEQAFRDLEAQATAELLDDAGVIALGGGAVVNPVVRGALAGRCVVWLTASVAQGVERIGQTMHRPLMRGDVSSTLERLRHEREHFYAQVARHRVDTDARPAGEVADQVAALVGLDGEEAPMTVAHFATDRPYDARIRPGALDDLTTHLGGATKVAIFFPEVLGGAAARASDVVRAAGAEPTMIELPEGEQAKTPVVLADCWGRLADAGLTRTDLVIGIGGGATTDLAGFVAATWLRGIRWISVPTTVLAMVDAGIGGKTGADLPQGKNLIGAFWEPSVVLEDTDLLVGLPARQVRSGLAEVIKHGFIADERTLELVSGDPAQAQDVTSGRLAELIARSVQVKARVVSSDLRESTSVGDDVGREQLNYGHTLGHAIEAAEHFTRPHGECVALGMVFAAELAHRVIGLDEATVARHRRVLGSVGLPTSYHGVAWPALHELMMRDKKTRGSVLRFVGLRAQGEPTIIVDPDPQALRGAWQALTATTD